MWLLREVKHTDLQSWPRCLGPVFIYYLYRTRTKDRACLSRTCFVHVMCYHWLSHIIDCKSYHLTLCRVLYFICFFLCYQIFYGLCLAETRSRFYYTYLYWFLELWIFDIKLCALKMELQYIVFSKIACIFVFFDVWL